MGPVMVDIAGVRPNLSEIALIRHPLVGGVILFTRNFESPGQLEALTAELHDLKPELLIAVDHEGGRVQRFRDGFTPLPPMAALGAQYESDPGKALQLACAVGYVLAWELRTRGVDLSFAPVLDLDYGSSTVIGNRAFHRQPQVVAQLAEALCTGLHDAGFATVGKHFPGHGFVEADSHHTLPVDPRTFEAIDREDIEPFRRLIPDHLDGIMPAHIMYSAVDDKPAGFSPFWLQRVLRETLGFEGVIFSDDLSMKGAAAGGTPAERAYAALDAGCDMVLLCNDPEAAQELVVGIEGYTPSADSQRRLAGLRPRPLLHPAESVRRYDREQSVIQPFLQALKTNSV